MSAPTLTLTSADNVRESIANRGSKIPNWSCIWNGAGLPIMLLAAAWLSWGEIVLQTKALSMSFLTVLLYAGLLYSRYRTADYSSYRTIGMTAFYASAGFLLIFALLAITRSYYSRTFLLSSYIFVGLWMLTGFILFPESRPTYLVITGGAADRLKTLGEIDWNFQNMISKSEKLADYDGVVIDLHAHEQKKELLDGLTHAGINGLPIISAASVFEQYRGQTDLGYIAEEGLYEMSSDFIYPAIKRMFEVSIILLVAPLVLILAAFTALAIKITSPGPVMFTQPRVGRYGREYTLYKFRSMTVGADDEGAMFTTKNDSRLISIGPFIRKFRLDELPQIWNVLKGEMNLIGPRPEQKIFVESFNEEIPFYSYRHKVRPGITGWAQIKDGYAADMDATKIKLQHDLYYIKNLSLSLDLLIVYATVKTILSGFGSR